MTAPADSVVAMLGNLLGGSGTAGLIAGLAYIGGVVALAITGHISGADALAALSIFAGGATAVTATHVTAKGIGNAAAGPAGAGPVPAAPPAGPAPAADTVDPAATQPIVTV